MLKAKFRTDKRCEESSCRDRRCGWEQVPPTIKLSKFPLHLEYNGNDWNAVRRTADAWRDQPRKFCLTGRALLPMTTRRKILWGASSKPSNSQCVSQLSFPAELEKNQDSFSKPFFHSPEKLTQKKLPTGGASGPGGDRPGCLALPPCAGGPVPWTTEERRKRPGPGVEPVEPKPSALNGLR